MMKNKDIKAHKKLGERAFAPKKIIFYVTKDLFVHQICYF
jgi:hypothetical protein